jgi:hypothetical protein
MAEIPSLRTKGMIGINKIHNLVLGNIGIMLGMFVFSRLWSHLPLLLLWLPNGVRQKFSLFENGRSPPLQLI